MLLQGVAELRCCGVEQREVVLGRTPLAARTDRQDPDPVAAGLEPAHLDPVEAERSREEMSAARFDHRLEPTYGDRVEGEASGLGGAKAASGDEVELGVCVEQSERGHVGR